MNIREKFKTEIKAIYDVVVCGGGIAGISSALSSARSGKKTLLIEKEWMLGGLATAGLVTIYLPLCDGMGHQVSYSIAEELLKLSVSISHEEEDGYKDWIENAKTSTKNEKTARYCVNFNPQHFALSCEKLLIENDVDILYGTQVVSCQTHKGYIETISIENKSGRSAIVANCFVDATGDFDLGHLAHCPEKTFEQGNLLASWYYSYSKDGYNRKQLGCADIPKEDKKEGDEVAMLVPERYQGLDGVENSLFMIEAHKKAYEDLLKNRENDATYQIATLPSIPQFRMTRRMVGNYELSTADVHKTFVDSVGLVSDWKKRGPIYEIPFSSLINNQVKNLISCGRCTSCTEGMWDLLRVIPCCAVTGEAAGLAASMTNTLPLLPIDVLQSALKERGIPLHESEIL